jgi:hypothetical protein
MSEARRMRLKDIGSPLPQGRVLFPEELRLYI